MGACASVAKAMRARGDAGAAAPPPEQPKEETTAAAVTAEVAEKEVSTAGEGKGEEGGPSVGSVVAETPETEKTIGTETTPPPETVKPEEITEAEAAAAAAEYVAPIAHVTSADEKETEAKVEK